MIGREPRYWGKCCDTCGRRFEGEASQLVQQGVPIKTLCGKCAAIWAAEDLEQRRPVKQ